ncbi:hypothetical protein SAMD00019534_009310 [Acytostelium subglobosum LB1]|uniref:hypothetical protein n=1 Tax=Acytostelium subglobosum LB1 TaxID=1410327 RepID=UPI000644BDE5|nr:hypothetical protein SAMD00019534_009310 [Acytostelium subglobosum LB1]GAM17756.1 hypothetical protein SAMD00019534_009310 [Acytostelium subglobosum LB1]|eukprot:XP_012758352.1 hypothetical protein SAMD00019534_009310 [Acytostelium subglobosum LB1]
MAADTTFRQLILYRLQVMHDEQLIQHAILPNIKLKRNLIAIIQNYMLTLDPASPEMRKLLLDSLPQFFQLTVASGWYILLPIDKRDHALQQLMHNLCVSVGVGRGDAPEELVEMHSPAETPAATDPATTTTTDTARETDIVSDSGPTLAGMLVAYLMCLQRTVDTRTALSACGPRAPQVIDMATSFCLHANIYHLALVFYSHYALLSMVPQHSTVAAFAMYHRDMRNSPAARHWRSLRQTLGLTNDLEMHVATNYPHMVRYMARMQPFLDVPLADLKATFARSEAQVALEQSINEMNAPEIAKHLATFNVLNRIPLDTTLLDLVPAVTGQAYHAKTFMRLLSSAQCSEQISAILFNPNYFLRQLTSKVSTLELAIQTLKTQARTTYATCAHIIVKIIVRLLESGTHDHARDNSHATLGLSMLRQAIKYNITFTQEHYQEINRMMSMLKKVSGYKIPVELHAHVLMNIDSSLGMLLRLELELESNPDLPIDYDHLKLYSGIPKNNSHFVRLGLRLLLEYHTRIRGLPLNKETLLSIDMRRFVMTKNTADITNRDLAEELYDYLLSKGRPDLVVDLLDRTFRREGKLTVRIPTTMLYKILVSLETLEQRIKFFGQHHRYRTLTGRYHPELEALLRTDASQTGDLNIHFFLVEVAKHNAAQLERINETLVRVELSADATEFIQTFFDGFATDSPMLKQHLPLHPPTIGDN